MPTSTTLDGETRGGRPARPRPAVPPVSRRRRDGPGRTGPRRDNLLAWVFLAPSVTVFALFLLYPLGRTVYLSMHGNDIIGRPSRFVGLSHFQEMMSADFGKVLLTTALFTVGVVVPGVIGALAVVLLLESKVRAQRFFRSAFALPFAFSVASASVIFAVFYNPASGVLNGILHHLGMSQVAWLTSQEMALLSICLTTVWMNLGYGVLVLAAGVGAIPREVNEAALLDGATGPRRAWYITVPLLGPQLFFLIVISTINALQGFGQIHILTQGGPVGSTTTLVYSIYQHAFAYGTSDFGRASAQALVLLLMVLLCTALQFGVIERKVHYS
ncbi:sugar ABC transporter permease [Streptomyces sp. ACA25]|uniref:carbohydrate ABC transporter permease n=1 Tax=Streptomyces sp. ACA25 TaxID=3022596 RepID=UPI0023072C12|nr:sugar ABC transporter permease [Streptomyces sp. ACA25]MDB1087479.1 sugar ABC transporter permease [Streptomyces sp. ACA25]